ncbi:hypothetical protein IAR55_000582 [Kwoniella newhampshirensis]|uniref:Autophagy-related protein 2 n=1 Tax=Kwoniella newhampshirensis TaxID=1651941 RepID=A0AAW0Z706_9TREE
MFSLPSFFTTFPFALPSLPSISLPANIQRRFLSYVLKRALGRFVRHGALDAERIQAQISEGWLEIEKLEVDTAEINALLPPSVPLTLTAGSIDKVTARVPLNNLWSDPLSLTLETLTLDFTLKPPTGNGKGPSLPSRHAEQHRDLAGSVTSAADDFLHEELDAFEEAELDRSIRQSLILSHNDPFPHDEVPGSFPFSGSSSPGTSPEPLPATVESTTVLAGLVERILARLEFKVNNIRVRIRYDDEDHGGLFELRIGEIQYADESLQQEQQSGDEGVRFTIRAVRISSINVYLRSNPPAASTPPGLTATSSRSSSISSSSSSSSGHNYSDMVMSQAVVDLRDSTASALGSEASIYHSVISEQPIDNQSEHDESDSAGATSRSATPTPAEPRSTAETLIMSFGSEDIILRMKNIRPVASSSSENSSSPANVSTLPSSPNQLPPHHFIAGQLPSVDVEITIGTLTVIILPRQATIILAALQAAARLSKEEEFTSTAPLKMSTTNSDQPKMTTTVRMKAIYVSLIYDMEIPNASISPSNLAQYWAKPSTTYVPHGHLRLRLDSLDARYVNQGYMSNSNTITRPIRTISSTRLPRRQSTTTRFGPPPPTLTVTLNDFSLFEYLASDVASGDDSDDVPPGGAFPVIMFDSNLPKQYDVAPGATSGSLGATSGRTPSASAVFAEFDSVDWRNSGMQRKSGGGEKQWKVKQKGKGILKGTAGPVAAGDETPVIAVKKDFLPNTTAFVSAQPLHVFLDLSLVERLLPMLRSLAPVIRTSVEQPRPKPPFGLFHNTRPSGPPRQATTESIIDDLDAQASSSSTIQSPPRPKAYVDINCPLMRLDIRCPAPVNRRGSWGDGGHLRSGIVTLDIHHLRSKVTGAASELQTWYGRTVKETGDLPSTSGGGTSVECEKIVLFFSRAPERKSIAFFVIGPLAPEPGEYDNSPLLPSIEIKSNVSVTAVKTTTVTCRIPSVQAKIRQPTIEGLQFFADDMTHWLDGAFGDGSAPKPRDDLKMIGSRFFGGSARGSSSASSSTEDEDEEALAAVVLRVAVSEADISLHVPRTDPPSAQMERVLSLRASDIDTKVESNTAGRHETAFSVSVMDADFSDRSDPFKPKRILGRTSPFTFTSHQQPLVHLRFSSLANTVTDTKETGIKAVCSCMTFLVNKDIEWVKELALFAKTPEGVFENVVPSEVTRISVQLHDSTIHLAAPTLPGAVVVVLGSVEVKTDIRSDADENLVEVGAERVGVLAVDDLAATAGLPVGLTDSTEAWKKAGYAHIIGVTTVEIQCLRDLTGSSELSLDVQQVQIKVTACADSLATFAQLVSDLQKLLPPRQISTDHVRSPISMDQSVDILASVDEDAFNRIPDIVSGADMIDDDLPHNLDYLDHALRRSGSVPTADSVTGESLRAWQTADGEAEIGAQTIKILFTDVFDMDEDYWESLPVLTKGSEDDVHFGQTRIRVHNASIKILLHDGYDWSRTRKAIEDEIKAVRRRLERIRQLLASGQKADESIERATSTVLFNSVYIGLEGKGGGMDSAALIAAIDEELDELGADTASQNSWQTLPAAGPGLGHDRENQKPSSKKTRLKGKRLTRSKKPQIEISLTGLRADVDLFPPELVDHDQVEALSSTASRMNVTVREMEILDHIKTSTWKKFLTEMKADSRGNVRETDSDMVRIELVGVRLGGGGASEEMRLRAKILPLRLHVDQDALDFLKRFFSFKLPPGSSSMSQSISSPSPVVDADAEKMPKSFEPFFQHVEIFPIELKLDYKPKRVDFAALREGKTIELMNFFHFDGAEMTLRHITLSGITGWEKIGSTLQDLWTPDVKANQLADVISGVSPIRSIVNVGSGVADLILLPIEQYRKDGRLAKGVQRGTGSFVKSTALELMKIGASLATGTQVILEKAEGVLGGGGRFGENVVGQVEGASPNQSSLAGGDWDLGRGPMGDHGGGTTRGGEGGSSSEDDDGENEPISRYANQPEGVREGVQAAYKSLSRNVNAAAQTILAVPMEVYERSGDDGPLRAVVRAVPIAVLKPMIGTTEAVRETLLGLRNSLDPSARRDLGDKYK